MLTSVLLFLLMFAPAPQNGYHAQPPAPHGGRPIIRNGCCD